MSELRKKINIEEKNKINEEEKKKVLNTALRVIADKYERILSEDNITGSGININKGVGFVTFYERRGDQEIWYYHVKVDVVVGNVTELIGKTIALEDEDYNLPDEFYAEVLDIEEKKDKYGKPALFMRIKLPDGKINTQKYLSEHIHKLLTPAMKKLGLKDTNNFIGNTYKFIKKGTSLHSKVRWIPDQDELGN
jgi:hypothetical protein